MSVYVSEYNRRLAVDIFISSRTAATCRKTTFFVSLVSHGKIESHDDGREKSAYEESVLKSSSVYWAFL